MWPARGCRAQGVPNFVEQILEPIAEITLRSPAQRAPRRGSETRHRFATGY
jgi:hypothetical protein